MRPTQEGVDLLLGLTVSHLQSTGRLDVYVTHDGILAVLVSYLFQLPIDEIEWPGYLDGLLLWRRGRTSPLRMERIRAGIAPTRQLALWPRWLTPQVKSRALSWTSQD